MSNRIHVVLSDKELGCLDTLSKDLCLNRSQTIRKMITDGNICQPVYISNKDIDVGDTVVINDEGFVEKV